MKGFIGSALLSGIRSHSFQLLLGTTALVLFIAWLAANFSARAPATLALDIGLSGIRATLILMALFWVQELVGRDIERKTIHFVLAYPSSRTQYLIGRFLGVALLVAMASVFAAGLLWLTVKLNPVTYNQVTPVHLGWPYILTVSYLYVDLLVIAAFGICMATISTTPMLPLILGIGFAVICHSIGATLDFLRYSDVANQAQKAQLSPVLAKAIYFLPDLERLDIRNWALYGVTPGVEKLVWPLLMAAGYIAALLGIGLACFQRREFR